MAQQKITTGMASQLADELMRIADIAGGDLAIELRSRAESLSLISSYEDGYLTGASEREWYDSLRVRNDLTKSQTWFF